VTIAITVEIEDDTRTAGAPVAPLRADTPEDPLVPQARALAARHGTLSASLLQRTLRIGYRRAARLLARVRGG
jgi:DNA segregation ATPase FtsK/SpoIIIE-like protein